MERISALMDGELGGEDLVTELKRIKGDEDLMRSWETYHLIGDVLRKETALGAPFGDRFRTALEREPTVLAPRPVVSPRKVRLYALSAAASVAGVAAVAWLAFMNTADSLDGRVDQVARTSPATPIADATVKEYLLAHHAYSPATSIHGVASYVGVQTVGERERDMTR